MQVQVKLETLFTALKQIKSEWIDCENNVAVIVKLLEDAQNQVSRQTRCRRAMPCLKQHHDTKPIGG